MGPVKKSVLAVNVLYRFVGALLYPLASLVPSASGHPPKFFSFLIPLMFVGLAFGSTVMMARALGQAKNP
jgi:hypothetical protein